MSDIWSDNEDYEPFRSYDQGAGDTSPGRIHEAACERSETTDDHLHASSDARSPAIEDAAPYLRDGDGDVESSPLPRLHAAILRLQRRRPLPTCDTDESDLYPPGFLPDTSDDAWDAPEAWDDRADIDDDATVEHPRADHVHPQSTEGDEGGTRIWREGLVLSDKYVLIEEVAQGAWGAVWRAEQAGVQRSVAIKVLHPREERALEAARQRFEREARLASRIRHPSAVRIFDYGLQQCSPYLVMEWLEGTTLAESLAHCGALPSTLVETIARATVGALRAAHDEGVIHRDLKPGNIMLVESSAGITPVVVDFGLARTFDDDEPTVTRADMVIGTPAYMSPEAIRGETITPLSDIYSLGVTLIEAVLGHNPWRGASSAETMTRHLMSSPLEASTLVRAGCRPAFAEVLCKMVSLEPEERPQGANALERTLLAIDDIRPPHTSASSVLSRLHAPLPRTEELYRLMARVEWQRRRPTLLALALLGLAVMGVTAAAIVYKPPADPPRWSIRPHQVSPPLAATLDASPREPATNDNARLRLAEGIDGHTRARALRLDAPASSMSPWTTSTPPVLTLPDARGMEMAASLRASSSLLPSTDEGADSLTRDTLATRLPSLDPHESEVALETPPTDGGAPREEPAPRASGASRSTAAPRRRDASLPTPAAMGTLVVTASPAGRMIVDGKDYGHRSTLMLRDLSLRSYTVEVHRDGRVDRRSVVLRTDTRHVERFFGGEH